MDFDGRGAAMTAAAANFGVALSGVVAGDPWGESWSWVGSHLVAAVVSMSSRREVLSLFLGAAEVAVAVAPAAGGKKQGRRNRRRASILAIIFLLFFPFWQKREDLGVLYKALIGNNFFFFLGKKEYSVEKIYIYIYI